MSDQPLVSVIVPAYNAAPFLERTLASVLAQTHRNLDIIVVNDGSTDGTQAIAQIFANHDNRVRVVRTDNGGVARARNRGMNEAHGSLLAFVDADDLWHPRKIEHQVAALTGDVALVYTLTRVIDTGDHVLFNASVPTDGYALAQHLYLKGVGNGSSLLVRREVAQAVGGYDPAWIAHGIGGCEDLDFELKVAAGYAIATVPLFLTGYRVSPGNMSSNNRRMARAMAAVVETHLRAHPELPTWAARRVRVATMRSALDTLRNGDHHAHYARLLARLFQVDPQRAADYVARTAIRTLRQQKRALRQPKHVAGQGVPFPAFAPETGAGERVAFFAARERKLLTKLKSLDTELAKVKQLRCVPLAPAAESRELVSLAI